MPTQETNSSGETTFDLAEGNYSATASMEGYADSSTSFTLEEGDEITRTITLTAEDPATLNVTVTDGSTGDPIDGATVTAGSTSGTTDSTGAVSLSVSAGEYEVEASANGYLANSTPVSVDWGETRSVSLVLEPEESPTLVDDFERSAIDPWYNTHVEDNDVTIATSAGIVSDRGLKVVPASSASVYSGLDNFPRAEGGPNNDGAWEAYFRFNEFGGTTESVRLEFAAEEGGTALRWQVSDDSISLRVGSSWQYTLGSSQGVGDVRILRVNEWRTDGYLDASVHDANGTELDREARILDPGSDTPSSGGLRVWSNYSTGADFDNFQLLG